MNFKIFFLTTSLFASTCWAEFSIKPYDKATDEQVLVVCLVETMMETDKSSNDSCPQDKMAEAEVELSLMTQAMLNGCCDGAGDGGYCFGLYNDQNIIGLLTVTPDSPDYSSEDKGLDFEVILNDAYRQNQPLFQKVLELVIELAKKHKQDRLYSSNHYGNFSTSFFKSKGFTINCVDKSLEDTPFVDYSLKLN